MTDQSSSRHVARVFQQPDDKRQHKNLRHEDQKSADSAKQCVRGKVPRHLITDQRHNPVRHCAEHILDRIHQRCGPGEYGLKQQVHNKEKGNTADHRMEKNTIQSGLVPDQHIAFGAKAMCEFMCFSTQLLVGQLHILATHASMVCFKFTDNRFQALSRACRGRHYWCLQCSRQPLSIQT